MNGNLRKSLAEYIIGKRESIRLIGPPTVIAVVYETTQASRELYVALETGRVPLVEGALRRKKEAVERWERVTGMKWDL
jgi:hypothetical protein